MKASSLFILLVFLTTVGLFSQPLSFGLAPRLVAPITTDAQVGQGWGLEAWSQVELGSGNGVKLRLGLQEFGDYDSGVDIRRVYVYPDRSIAIHEFAQMRKLQTAYVDLSFWQLAWDIQSRWLFEIGARYSFDVVARGTYGRRQSFGFGQTSGNSTGLASNLLRDKDIGLRLSCSFELLDNCWLEAEAYQGFLNQWADFEGFDGPSVYVTTLSIGLAVKLFQVEIL